MNEELEKKTRGIVGLYNFYKYQMNTVQRIGLLSLWIEVCINKEEYEVAAGLQRELEKITNGDEEFYAVAPSNLIDPLNTMKKVIIDSIQPEIKKKKKLKFVSYWGTGVFEVFRFCFGDFKFVFLNLGLELR